MLVRVFFACTSTYVYVLVHSRSAETVSIVWVHTNRRNLSVHPVTLVDVTITVHSLAAELWRGFGTEGKGGRVADEFDQAHKSVDSDKTTAVTMDE